MKRFILSTAAVLLGMSALAPMASANYGPGQASTANQLSPTATLTDLVNHNRDVRSKS